LSALPDITTKISKRYEDIMRSPFRADLNVFTDGVVNSIPSAVRELYPRDAGEAAYEYMATYLTAGTDILDMRNTQWVLSPGNTTGGMLPKATQEVNGSLKYVTSYNAAHGVYGNEAVFDYIICNLDRHGKNIELFLDTLEMIPLFDNGLSLLSKIPEENIKGAKFNDNISVNNFIGSRKLLDNLKYVAKTNPVALNTLECGGLFHGLTGLLSADRMDTVKALVLERFDCAKKAGAVK
jgi:hypothetical protein